jgi:hypothetical protein
MALRLAMVRGSLMFTMTSRWICTFIGLWYCMLCMLEARPLEATDAYVCPLACAPVPFNSLNAAMTVLPISVDSRAATLHSCVSFPVS